MEVSVWVYRIIQVTLFLICLGLVIERLQVQILAGAAGKFLPQSYLCVLTLILCPFHPHVTATALKRPQSLCQKCKWRVTPKHACTLDPTKSEWADYFAVQAQCGNLWGNKLTCNSSGNTRPPLSQLAEPLWTDPGLESGISVCKLIISTWKKKKKYRQGMNAQTLSQNPCNWGKSYQQ